MSQIWGRVLDAGGTHRTGRLVLPLSEVRRADVGGAGRSAVALARLLRAGVPVRPGFVVVPAAREGLERGAGDPDPSAAREALATAYAGLGIEDMGGVRVRVHPVLGGDDPLPSPTGRSVMGVPAVRAELLALWRGSGADRALLVQAASPAPEHAGWAYEVGRPGAGPVLVAETGPFVAAAARPPVPGVLDEVARLTRLAGSVLGERCDIGWACVRGRVDLVDARVPDAGAPVVLHPA